MITDFAKLRRSVCSVRSSLTFYWAATSISAFHFNGKRQPLAFIGNVLPISGIAYAIYLIRQHFNDRSFRKFIWIYFILSHTMVYCSMLYFSFYSSSRYTYTILFQCSQSICSLRNEIEAKSDHTICLASFSFSFPLARCDFIRIRYYKAKSKLLNFDSNTK